MYEYFVVREKEVATHALFSVATTLVVTIILKELFLVPRPYMQMGIEPEAGLAIFSSFPSAHAALAFALATSVGLHQKRIGIFCLVIASLVAIGRVAAFVHYPIDIAFGVLVGVLVAVFFDTIHFSKVRNNKKKH